MSTRAHAEAGPAPADVFTRVPATDEACVRVTRAVLGALLPCSHAAAAGHVAITLEVWLRRHAGEVGASAVHDLAEALDVDADLADLRRSTCAP